MKIRNFLTILFAVLAILLLVAIAGFMTVYVADDSDPFRQQIMSLIHRDDPAAEPAQSPETNAGQPATEAVKTHSLFFVGDSRTIGMRDAVNDGCTYIGKEGEGYMWFASEGIQELSAALAADPKQTVILNFGVNDPENISLYIDFYHAMEEDYPDTSFYYLSVNPLVDSENFNTTNEMISLFNATMKSAFPDNYLDSNVYLTGAGYETVDGLHYTEDTYRMIHNFVVDKLS